MTLWRRILPLVPALALGACADVGESGFGADAGGGFGDPAEPDAGAPGSSPDADEGSGGSGGGGGGSGGDDGGDDGDDGDNGNGNGDDGDDGDDGDNGNGDGDNGNGDGDDAEPRDVTLTHNDVFDLPVEESPDSGEPFVGCFQLQGDEIVAHRSNNYFKVFDPEDFEIERDVRLDEFRMGIHNAESDNETIQVGLALAQQDDPLEPEPAAADPIVTLTIDIPTDDGTDDTVNFPAIATLDFSDLEDELVMEGDRPLLAEFALPDGVNDGDAEDLFTIGVNFEGEDRGSFLQAPSCGHDEPRPFDGIFDSAGNDLGTRDWLVELNGVEGAESISTAAASAEGAAAGQPEVTFTEL